MTTCRMSLVQPNALRKTALHGRANLHQGLPTLRDHQFVRVLAGHLELGLPAFDCLLDA
jgi:hypothetical protein